jgi:hypothetical protein
MYASGTLMMGAYVFTKWYVTHQDLSWFVKFGEGTLFIMVIPTLIFSIVVSYKSKTRAKESI